MNYYVVDVLWLGSIIFIYSLYGEVKGLKDFFVD